MEDIFGAPPPRASTPVPAAPPRPAGPAPASPRPDAAISMADIFGEPSRKEEKHTPSPSPFHGDSSVVMKPGAPGGNAGLQAGLLDFIDDAGKADAAVKAEEYQIRKRSGRIMGPFDVGTVLSMFNKGELLGSEEGSTDGVTWKPLAQLPAFAEAIQSAMAAAIGGDTMPGAKDTRRHGIGAVDEELAVGTADLRAAEKAKDDVARNQRLKAEGGRANKAMFAGALVLLLGVVGVAVNFLTPYGWFGYKIAFPDAAPPPEEKPHEDTPPPTVAESKESPDALRARDTYVAYRQAADQFQRVVDAGKAQVPPPAEVGTAAAELGHFLAYLVVVEDMSAFVQPLRDAIALAIGGNEVSVAIAKSASSFADQQWDTGLQALRPLEKAPSLTPAQIGEIKLWVALGLRGKGDIAGANAALDEALQLDTKAIAPLYQQAAALAALGEREDALMYVDKLLAVSPEHPRGNILRGRLLGQVSDTVEQAKKILVDVSEGKIGEQASPPQKAQAFFERAEIAISARAYPEALRLMGRAVELVPNNRQMRVSAVDMAIRLRDYAVAKENGKKLLELAPGDAAGVVGLARAKLGTRDTLGAYTDLQNALKKAPDDATLNFWFGVAAKDIGKLDEARAQFTKAQTLDPKRAAPAVEQITDAIERGQLGEALRIADGAMAAVDPAEQYRIRAAKAYVYHRRWQLAEADAEFQKALDANPKFSDTRARYAELLVSMKRLDDADKQINEAQLMDERNPAVVLASGVVAMARDDTKGAMDKFEEAMQLSPNWFEPYLRAALAATKLKDVTRAKGFVETAGQLRPKNPDVINVQGQVQRGPDPKSSAGLLQQACDQAPEDPMPPYQLGLTFQSMGAFVEAIDALRKATTLAPQFDDAWFALGKVSREIGRQQEAKDALMNVTRIDKRRGDAWVEIADLLATMGDDVGALDAYEKALTIDPKNPVSVCSMGETLVVRMGEDMKNLKRGVEMLERCVKMNPAHATAFKNLGNAYKTINKKKDAVNAYKAHIKAHPEDPEAAILQDYISDLGG